MTAGAAELTRKEVVLTSDISGDHDRFQHYFEKAEISANLLNGTPMTALCGKVVVSQVDPKDRTVCSECQDWMENIVGMNKPGRDGRDA